MYAAASFFAKSESKVGLEEADIGAPVRTTRGDRGDSVGVGVEGTGEGGRSVTFIVVRFSEV
jgi:hypothetical protein